LSEYEQLVADIEPARSGVALADFTADDIAFLAAETGNPAARILMLQQSAEWARATRVLIEAFYGWLREGLPPTSPPTLDNLLDVPPAQLQAALTQAVTSNIIPGRVADSLTAIMARMAQLWREREARIQATYVPHQFVGRLLDQQTSEPLAGFRVHGFDLD